MKPTINLILPCAGLGSRFKSAGYDKPKPCIDVGGETMLSWVLSNFESIEKDTNLCLIVRKEHNAEYGIEKMVRENFKFARVNIIEIDYTTDGALRTVCLAAPYLVEGSIICANSDQFLDQFSAIDFVMGSQGSAVSILTFIEDDKETTKWSFVGRNSDGEVSHVIEKERVSDEGTVGIYYFACKDLFLTMAKNMFKYRIKHNGEYYLAPIANLYLMKGWDVKTIQCKKEDFHGLGTPEDLETFKKNYLKENV